jgi:phosphotransferase system  glucose/maltose/N-acetylglucosamine-specific IIC component
MTAGAPFKSGVIRLPHEDSTAAKSLRRAGLALLVIMGGLALRRYGVGLGLPGLAVKYGGSLLWGSMVFFLVASVASSLTRQRAAMIAVAIAICVEVFRLVHEPSLDAFRLTTAGALLLGRVFSPWNVLAYACGIAVAMLLDQFALSKPRPTTPATPHTPS